MQEGIKLKMVKRAIVVGPSNKYLLVGIFFCSIMWLILLIPLIHRSITVFLDE